MQLDQEYNRQQSTMQSISVPTKKDKSLVFQSNQLRESFKDLLTKMLQLPTRQKAILQTRKLISKHKTTSNIRTWLSVLTQNREKHIQSQLVVLKFIIQQYARGLLDPIDKNPSIQKTVFRITQLIIKYFSDSTFVVASMCQKCWMQMYLSSLEGQSLQAKKKLLYEPLEAIINGGGGKVSQTTAQLCIQGLLQVSLNSEDHDYFKQIAKRTLILFLKTTIIHSSSLCCLQSILSYFTIMNLIPLLENIIDKILSYIQLAQNNSQGYKIRSQCSNCLALIGEQIDNNGIIVFQKIYKVLDLLAIDKVWAVQSTARRAIQIWRNKKIQWDKEYAHKNQKFPEKQPNQQLRNSVAGESVSNDAQEIYSHRDQFNRKYQTDGWVDYNENPKYLHKNTGGGGGNTVIGAYAQKEAPNYQKNYETYQNKMQAIKKTVYDKKNISNVANMYDDTVPWQQAKNLPSFKKNINLQQPQHKQLYNQQLFEHQKNKVGEQKLIEKRLNKSIQMKDNSPSIQLVRQWQKILQKAQQDKMQDAVKQILLLDDDIYFIRFVTKYSSGLLKKLTKNTATKLLRKMLEIKKTYFMEQILLTMVSNATKLKIGSLMNNHNNFILLEALERTAKIEKLQKAAKKVSQAYSKSIQ